MNWHKISLDERSRFDEFVALQNKTTPLLKTTVDEVLKDIEILPKEFSKSHWLGYVDGKPVIAVDFGDCHWAHLPGKAYCYVYCDDQDSLEQLQIGLDFCIAELSSKGVTTLEVWTSTLTPLLTEILESKTGGITQKAAITRLDLTQFEFEKWLPSIKKIEDQGYRIATAKQLVDEGVDWITIFFPSMKEIRTDIPSPDPITHPDMEEFGTHMSRNALEDMYFAMLEGEIVGYSRLSPMKADPEVLETGLSGTVRAHRRKGIVTALKVKSFIEAKHHGRKWVQTDNEENNPMLTLNTALGFKEVDMTVCYHLEIA